MAGFQFVHLESFARVPSAKSKERRLSISEVVDEAARDTPSALPHVSRPRPAEVLFGTDPRSVEVLANQVADQAVDAKGRRLRKDAGVLLAGVASFPGPPGDPGVAGWEADVLRFVQAEFGERLRSVVRHTDERHAHVHFFVVPKVGPAGQLERLHPGEVARDQALAALPARAAKGAKTVGDLAYREAMRGFQDRYFEAVGMPQGQARFGPRRRRKSRPEWRAEQAANEANAKTIQRAVDADRRLSEVEGRAVQVERDRAAVEHDKAVARAVVLGAKAIGDGRIVGAEERAGERQLLLSDDVEPKKRQSLLSAIRPAWDFVCELARNHAQAVRAGIDRLLDEAQRRGDLAGTLTAARARHLEQARAARAIRAWRDGRER